MRGHDVSSTDLCQVVRDMPLVDKAQPYDMYLTIDTRYPEEVLEDVAKLATKMDKQIKIDKMLDKTLMVGGYMQYSKTAGLYCVDLRKFDWMNNGDRNSMSVTVHGYKLVDKCQHQAGWLFIKPNEKATSKDIEEIVKKQLHHRCKKYLGLVKIR